MSKQKIFISYSSDNQEENTLALRLHTIGAVNGFTMWLPDRYMVNEGVLGAATKDKIQQADWFVLFAISPINEELLLEINYALEVFDDPSRIVILYSAAQKHTLQSLEEGVTMIDFDPKEQVVENVLHIIKQRLELTPKANISPQVLAAFFALLLVGLGLYALAVLDQEEPQPKPN